MKKLTLTIPTKQIQAGPVRLEALTPQQIARLQKLQTTLVEVDGSPLEKWIDDFKRDENPDREIAVFEAIAQAYQTFCAAHPRTLLQKQDAHGLLLERSGTTDENALRTYKRKSLTEDEAKEVLSYYHKTGTPVQVDRDPANPFFLQKITDYWDSTTGAVESLAAKLDTYPEQSREEALAAIRAAVREHVRVIPDKFLCQVAFVVADDLYRSASYIPAWSATISDYLAASAGTFFPILRERGFILHYIVDNTFSHPDRPFQLFPEWFAACRLNYECPQLIQATDRLDPASALQSCSRRIQTYFARREHYVLLDIDSCDQSFDEPISQRAEKGVITIFRNQEPKPKTTVSVTVSGQPL